MSPQLELDLRVAQPVRGVWARWRSERPWSDELGGFFRRALASAPLWVPGSFLLQVLFLGLLPGWLESRRLARGLEDVETRFAALTAERSALEGNRAMLADPVWRARVARSLLDPSAEPLHLPAAPRCER
jgi:hypothetical protein